MLYILFGLSAFLLMSIISNIHFYYSYNKSIKENEKLSSKIKKLEIKKVILPGYRALIKNYPLKFSSIGRSFTVDYVVEILEVSESACFVKTLSFSTLDSVANESRNFTSVLNFINNSWIEKNMMELIVDKSTVREAKIGKILDDL